MNNYQQQLKDPRWQKKRLDVMDRDGFSCCICGCGLNDGIALNAHHILYKPKLKPWEYSNSNLITLCENCHQKVHKGEVVLSKATEKVRGITYYKYLMKNCKELSPNESIVYSVLLFHSQIENKAFYKEGLFCIDKVKDYILEHTDGIPCFFLSTKKLMEKTELTFPTVKKVLDNLRNKGYLQDASIRCPCDLLSEGYIKLPYNTGIKGKQLIFYSYLLNRATAYRGVIDTWAYRLEELCGMKVDDVYFMIKQLKKKGFVKRLKDGTLRINSPE